MFDDKTWSMVRNGNCIVMSALLLLHTNILEKNWVIHKQLYFNILL